METFYTDIPEFIVKTDDITKLSNRACENLKVGDEVILVSNEGNKKYVVSRKSDEDMSLVYCNSSYLIEVSYAKENDKWAYDATSDIDFSNMGGTQLYFHRITTAGDTDEIRFISTDGTPITNFELLELNVVDNGGFPIYYYDDNETATYIVNYVTFSGSSELVEVEVFNSTTRLEPMTVFENAIDTVTPL